MHFTLPALIYSQLKQIIAKEFGIVGSYLISAEDNDIIADVTTLGHFIKKGHTIIVAESLDTIDHITLEEIGRVTPKMNIMCRRMGWRQPTRTLQPSQEILSPVYECGGCLHRLHQGAGQDGGPKVSRFPGRTLKHGALVGRANRIIPIWQTLNYCFFHKKNVQKNQFWNKFLSAY